MTYYNQVQTHSWCWSSYTMSKLRPLMLSRAEELSSAALADGKVAASFQTGALRVWTTLKVAETFSKIAPICWNISLHCRKERHAKSSARLEDRRWPSRSRCLPGLRDTVKMTGQDDSVFPWSG